jgi:hypothetical protein
MVAAVSCRQLGCVAAVKHPREGMECTRFDVTVTYCSCSCLIHGCAALITCTNTFVCSSELVHVYSFAVLVSTQ